MSHHPLEPRPGKPDPEDIRLLAEDLHGALHRHNDACRANPDIQTDLVKLRDKVQQRYEQRSEKIPPKRDDFVP